MPRRLLNLVTLVVAGTGLAVASPAMGVDVSTGVRQSFDSLYQTLRQTEALLDVVDEDIQVQQEKVNELAWKFASGGDPVFIKAELQVVKLTLDAYDLRIQELNLTITETTGKLMRLRDAARRTRDAQLIREIDAALAFAADLGRRTEGSFAAVDHVRGDIASLEKRMNG